MASNTISIQFKVIRSTKDPKWIGNTLAFCYCDHNPLFTIGPNCILILVYRDAFCWS